MGLLQDIFGGPTRHLAKKTAESENKKQRDKEKAAAEAAAAERKRVHSEKTGMLSAFARKLDSAPGPTKLQAEAVPTGTGEVAGFDALRKRTEQRATASGQTTMDSLK